MQFNFNVLLMKKGYFKQIFTISLNHMCNTCQREVSWSTVFQRTNRTKFKFKVFLVPKKLDLEFMDYWRTALTVGLGGKGSEPELDRPCASGPRQVQIDFANWREKYIYIYIYIMQNLFSWFVRVKNCPRKNMAIQIRPIHKKYLQYHNRCVQYCPCKNMVRIDSSS